MNRRLTIIASLVLGIAAIGVYELKYEVAELEADAVRLAAELAKERQALHVLATDWAYLNRPEYLSELVEEHLDLVPLDADRIVAVQDLPRRVTPTPELAQIDAAAGPAGDEKP